MLVLIGDITIGNEGIGSTPLCHFQMPKPTGCIGEKDNHRKSHKSQNFFVTLHHVSVAHAPHFVCLDLFNTILVQVCYV